MNEIITGLLFIERQAQKKLSAIEDEKSSLQGRIAEARMEIENRVNAENDERISVIRKKLSDESNEKILDTESAAEKTALRIKKQFEENAGKWEEEIFGWVTET